MVKTRTALDKRRSGDSLNISVNTGHDSKVDSDLASRRKTKRDFEKTSVSASEDTKALNSSIRSKKNLRKRDRTMNSEETSLKYPRRMSKRIKVLDKSDKAIKSNENILEKNDKVTRSSGRVVDKNNKVIKASETLPKSQGRSDASKKTDPINGSTRKSTRRVSNPNLIKDAEREVSARSSDKSKYDQNKTSKNIKSPRKETNKRSTRRELNPSRDSLTRQDSRRDNPSSRPERSASKRESQSSRTFSRQKRLPSEQDRQASRRDRQAPRTGAGNIQAPRRLPSRQGPPPRQAPPSRQEPTSRQGPPPIQGPPSRPGFRNLQAIEGQPPPPAAGGAVQGLGRIRAAIPRVPRHRCTRSCPVGCQGHLRPNEIIIYESFKFERRLLGSDRYIGRIIPGSPGGTSRMAGGSPRAAEGGPGMAGGPPRIPGGPPRMAGGPTRVAGGPPRVAGCAASHGDSMLQRTFGFGRRGSTLRNTTAAARAGPGANDGVRRNEVPEPSDASSPALYKGLPFIEIPVNIEMLLSIPHVSMSVQLENAWNDEDKSRNIYLNSEDPRVFHRHPVAQSTDAIRTKVGYSAGVHAWEVSWPVSHRGTHAVVGVATGQAALYAPGYQSLVGIDEESWGWDLGRGKAYHNSKTVAGMTYPGMRALYKVPGRFIMVLDMDRGELSFMVGGRYLGVAHAGLKDKKLYPVASSVWGHCEVGLAYLGGTDPGVMSLMDLCRRTVRRSVGPAGVDRGDIGKLNMPTIITNYLERRK